MAESRMKPIDLNSPDLEDAQVEIAESKESCETPVQFRTGAAGTGKTFSIRAEIEEDPSRALLCATTGIAATNLGTTTLHSALGLHPDSIDDQFTTGYMRSRMHQIARNHRAIGIDEMSMLRHNLLDMLYTTAEQVNEYADIKESFGIILVGDLCQLPPIQEDDDHDVPWVMNAECWPKFQANTTKLTKNYRQGDGTFLDALNALRRGDGKAALPLLRAAGVHFERDIKSDFDGTTIVGINKHVENHNKLRYWKLRGKEQRFKSVRWGKENGGWRHVPEVLVLKEGAYVMALSNNTSRDPLTKQPRFRWVNGFCGHVKEMTAYSVSIEFENTKRVETLDYIVRETSQKHTPDVLAERHPDLTEKELRAKYSSNNMSEPFWDVERSRWIVGALQFMPLRLAYATTVHKSQGLSLDKIQVDARHAFLGESAMLYVACSRARAADGLHIIGDASLVERRCKLDPKVLEWL